MILKTEKKVINKNRSHITFMIKRHFFPDSTFQQHYIIDFHCLLFRINIRQTSNLGRTHNAKKTFIEHHT